jgi:hypothetical protein
MTALDWSAVMSRPDMAQCEKAERWATHCRERGIKPDPKAYDVPGHDWREVDSMFTNEFHTEVRCKLCGVTGERDERDGSVFWPAT